MYGGGGGIYLIFLNKSYFLQIILVDLRIWLLSDHHWFYICWNCTVYTDKPNWMRVILQIFSAFGKKQSFSKWSLCIFTGLTKCWVRVVKYCLKLIYSNTIMVVMEAFLSIQIKQFNLILESTSTEQWG